MASSHTTRTLERLRKNGCVVDVCEKWIPNPKHPGGGFRRDLFGLFDVVALMSGKIIGIQSTGIANRSAHLKKMLSKDLQPLLSAWCKAGGGVELWAWEKKKNRWQPRVQRIEWEPLGPVEETKTLALISEEVEAETETGGKPVRLFGSGLLSEGKRKSHIVRK